MSSEITRQETTAAIEVVPNVIAGEAVTTGAREQVLNPYTGEVLYEVPQAGEAELRRALDAAVAAFADVRRWPAHRRASCLREASRLLRERAEDVALTIAREAGKPLKAARVEVGRSAENLAFAADAAADLAGEGLPLDASVYGEGRVGFTVRAPRGVIAAISPFNFPLNLALHKVGPALAGGNTVILKPAPQTPKTAVILARLLVEAGFPPGAISVLHGGADLGNALVTAPDVAMVSFTGSPQVGQAIARACGLKPVVLELGNNSANLVDEHADVDAAARLLAVAGFAYAGQVCIHPQRLIIHERVYEQFRATFLEAVGTLKVGDPLDDTTDVGPLINDAGAARLNAWVDEAVSFGGTLLAGGHAEGRLMPPTVLEDVPEHAQLVCNEAFGPVVVLQRVDSWTDAIDTANRSRFGLQTGVFSTYLPHVLQAVRDIEAGGVIVNDTSAFRVDQMPYGGVKDSGVGREGARAALEELTYVRSVVLR
ncbi:aldehyde dehydrogenase family protein [Deinococcus maricopensis]|uniref:Aldehyde Dehydrogenase n=1 Tax=Deinococcus maricopensis (strain DSM 21211 / LMG 22137 / NRRL B-23946 / LB-34) TaxID=709986 RepID=E8U8Z2_DEIML|nr:aldehyde dehydrogenase family protein [Deinococcus maricopensis]ADV67531.1 Aldehyde Dehydrogenase [Deinococcus maricopensis DSM 21211]